MTYRVIYSEYIRHRNGTYEPVKDTALSLGETESLTDANNNSLWWDDSSHIAWVEKLVDGIWYACDHNGHLYNSKIPADPQEVPLDKDIE